MKRRIAGTVAAAAVTLSLGAVGAPTASAAETATPAQGQGSIGLCLVIPLGSLVYPICL
ncbi:hypothetical protein [Rhodococcus sp. SGAir0479]|uniref:hypothetical protein n=1 Tax=Rhodococcus sp. SGAir0479 TaxID=2567884 RepID=UPI001586282A|nr:hypothetical protein [Rhodococcus sp. SGAir0479]